MLARRCLPLFAACASLASAQNATARPLRAGDLIYYMRPQKSATKTVSHLLRGAWMWAADARLAPAAPADAAAARRRGCGAPRFCTLGVDRMLAPDPDDAAARVCVVEGYCSLGDVVSGRLRATLARRGAPGGADAAPARGGRLRLFASLREPVERLLHEYVHVCAPTPRAARRACAPGAAATVAQRAWNDYRAECSADCECAGHPTARACGAVEGLLAFARDARHAAGARNRQSRMLGWPRDAADGLAIAAAAAAAAERAADAPARLRARAEARGRVRGCLLYTSPSPRDRTRSRMPSSA